MQGRERRPSGIGLLLVTAGVSIVACLLSGGDTWPRSLPGVLFGLSMVSFGWSLLSRDHRGR